MRLLTKVFVIALLFTTTAHGFQLPEPLSVAKFGKPETRQIRWSSQGQPKVLFFWASWCEYCEQFSQIIKKYSSRQDLQVYSIGTDQEKDKSREAQVNKYAAFKKNSGWLSNEQRTQMQIEIIPAVVLINKQGKIDTVYIGSQADKLGYFEKRLKYLLQIEDGEGVQ